MVGVQWPGVGVLLIIVGLAATLWGTKGLAYSEPITEKVVDGEIEDRIKPVYEKFEEQGRMEQQDAGFEWIAEAIQRRAPKDRKLERIESLDTEERGRNGISLVFADGVEESSMSYLISAISDFRDHQYEANQWKAVKYSLEVIITGFALQILGLIIDRVLVL